MNQVVSITIVRVPGPIGIGVGGRGKGNKIYKERCRWVKLVAMVKSMIALQDYIARYVAHLIGWP